MPVRDRRGQPLQDNHPFRLATIGFAPKPPKSSTLTSPSQSEAPMPTEETSQSAISEAALKVFSREELTQMPRPQRLSLMHLISKRIKKEGPPPTLDELQGIKELVTEHLFHPALSALSPASPTSTTTSSRTSASQPQTAPPSNAPSAARKLQSEAPETEADGMRAEALRRLQVRRLLKGQAAPTNASSQSPSSTPATTESTSVCKPNLSK